MRYLVRDERVMLGYWLAKEKISLILFVMEAYKESGFCLQEPSPSVTHSIFFYFFLL